MKLRECAHEVVEYGALCIVEGERGNHSKAAKELSQTAKNQIRLNQSHPETIFRARLDHLKPETTYYYTVTSMGADGQSDGVESPVNQFTTPAAGEVINNYPQPK